MIGWEERELWEGERNVWTLWQPWQAPVDGLSVCVDIVVREQREEVGTTVPIQSVRTERSEHTLSHTTQHNTKQHNTTQHNTTQHTHNLSISQSSSERINYDN